MNNMLVVFFFFFFNKPPMSNSRMAFVHRAFHKIDKNGDGVITINDLKGVYNVR